MGKILFIIAQAFFNYTELEVPMTILKDSGYKCDVASIEKNECTSHDGKKIMPDFTCIEANKYRIYYDAVVVVGGKGSPKLADYPEVLNILKRLKEKGKVIAGICLGPAVLAKAGVLEGTKATVYPDDWAVQVLVDNGAEYRKDSVVVDGRIVTADGPKSAEKFGKALLDVLQE